MPSRTQIYSQVPWTGGQNDSVDPGFLPASDLQIAENIIFTTSQTRKKRDALEYFDTDLPAVTHRESSGTTRTLTFASNINSGSDELLVVGENITVTGGPTSYRVTATPITAVTSNTISYTASGSVTESSTADVTFSVERSSAYIAKKDYWRTDASYVKVQRFVAVTNQGKLFYFNSSGQRFEIKSHPQEFTVVCGNTASLSQSDYFDFNSLTTSYRVWYDIDAAGVAPADGGRTLVEVNIATGNTAAQVANATQAALDALTGVTATVDSATVTVVLEDQGTATAPADGNTNFTITVTKTGRSKSAPFPATITKACMEVMNDVLLVSFDGVTNKAIRYRPETDTHYYQLGSGLAGLPDFSVMRVHQSRLWTNDKTNNDRLHYSAVGDFENWNGDSTSGALDVFPGDGDGDGLQTIYPPFRGILFVAKGQRLYRIAGDDEDNYSPSLVTSGLGSMAHNAVSTVDLDDVLFVSSKGIHSLAATDQFGDFNAQFLSFKIQNTFNSLVSTRLKFAQSAYIPDLNTVFFTVTEDGNSQNNAVYLFNTMSKEWAVWPGIDCQSITPMRVGSSEVFVFGTSNSRIILSSGESGLDFGTTSFRFRVKTGSIYVQGRPDAISMFKRLSLLYKPRGTFTITAKIKIDNQPVQSVSFSQSTGGDVLGSTFTLGTSILGSSNVLAPYERQIEGIGRGLTIELEASGQDDQIEVYGFTIEYEAADKAQEVIESES
jgi:hypothetical protein